MRNAFFSPSNTLSLDWLKLFTHHADAWITTLAISSVALVIHNRLSAGTLALSAAIAAGYWAGFALNDYFDVDVDQLDAVKKRKNYFVGCPHPSRFILGIILVTTAAIFPVFFAFGWRSLAIILISALIMWSYSAPPLRLKIRPGFDLLAHALFVQTFPYVATVYLIYAEWLVVDTVLVGLGLLTSTGAQLEQQIRDARHDAIVGRTSALKIGPHHSLIILKWLTAIMILYGLFFVLNRTIPAAVAPFGLIAIPAVIPRFWRRVNQPRPERLIRFLLVIEILYLLALISFKLSPT